MKEILNRIMELMGKTQKNLETLTELFARFRLRLTFEELMILKGLAQHNIQEVKSISSTTDYSVEAKKAFLKKIKWSFNGPANVLVDYAGFRYTYYASMTGSHDCDALFSGKVRVTVTPSGTVSGNMDIYLFDISNANQTLEQMVS